MYSHDPCEVTFTKYTREGYSLNERKSWLVSVHNLNLGQHKYLAREGLGPKDTAAYLRTSLVYIHRLTRPRNPKTVLSCSQQSVEGIKV